MQDKTPAENGGATTGQLEPRFEEILTTIRDSLSDLACSDHEQDEEHEEDDEDDSELNKLSDDDEPGWVMDTISKAIQHRMESFRPKQMRIDELTQPGWGEAANYIHARCIKYGTAEFKVPAVVQPQIDTTGATPSPRAVDM
jgi:hypothetical protein